MWFFSNGSQMGHISSLMHYNKRIQNTIVAYDSTLTNIAHCPCFCFSTKTSTEVNHQSLFLCTTSAHFVNGEREWWALVLKTKGNLQSVGSTWCRLKSNHNSPKWVRLLSPEGDLQPFPSWVIGSHDTRWDEEVLSNIPFFINCFFRAVVTIHIANDFGALCNFN